MPAIAVLGEAVYAPDMRDRHADQPLVWAEAEWVVLVADNGGSLVSMAGAFTRPARHDQKAVRIAGLGNVKTHPCARRQGYAEAAIAEVRRFHLDQGGLDFALLFCTAHNVPFYRKRGWQSFHGDVLIAQPPGTVRFTSYGAMCQGLDHPAPEEETIDLCGLPW